VVIHVDTDVCEEPGYDVSRRDAQGQTLSVQALIAAVRDKLIAAMGGGFADYESKVVFAVAVDSIECWLLPLLYDERAKQKKIAGCQAAANEKLRRLNREPLSSGESKFVPRYERESSEFRKQSTLMKHRDKNPSLFVFIAALDALVGA